MHQGIRPDLYSFQSLARNAGEEVLGFRQPLHYSVWIDMQILCIRHSAASIKSVIAVIMQNIIHTATSQCVTLAACSLRIKQEQRCGS